MRREDIALFIEIKKMKPLEVQIALRFFQEISVESYEKKEPSNPNENFHAIVARMIAQASVEAN